MYGRLSGWFGILVYLQLDGCCPVQYTGASGCRQEDAPVAAKNQNTLVYGLNPTGSNRVWTIGANTQYPELCMAIIDYLATRKEDLNMNTVLRMYAGSTWMMVL